MHYIFVRIKTETSIFTVTIMKIMIMMIGLQFYLPTTSKLKPHLLQQSILRQMKNVRMFTVIIYFLFQTEPTDLAERIFTTVKKMTKATLARL